MKTPEPSDSKFKVQWFLVQSSMDQWFEVKIVA